MRRFLHDGLLENSAYENARVAFNRQTVTALFRSIPKLVPVNGKSLEVRFVVDHKMDDGRFANNGWLQEISDPISKIAWDNAILVSPALARELDIYPKGSLLQVARVEESDLDALAREQAHVGEITIGAERLAVLFTFSRALKLHRRRYARLWPHQIRLHWHEHGYNAYLLRTSDTMHVATGAALKITEDRYLLANTQAHWSMEGRDLVREANYDEYRENPAFVREMGMETETPSTIGEVGRR